MCRLVVCEGLVSDGLTLGCFDCPCINLGYFVCRVWQLRRDITAVQPLDTPGGEATW